MLLRHEINTKHFSNPIVMCLDSHTLSAAMRIVNFTFHEHDTIITEIVNLFKPILLLLAYPLKFATYQSHRLYHAVT